MDSVQQHESGIVTINGTPCTTQGGPTASVLDLGSNSIKMSHYAVDAHNDFKMYYQTSARLRLLEGLKGGVMRSEYVDETIRTLNLFRERIEFEGICHVVGVATSAIRDASNRVEIIDRIRAETGYDFKILSDDEEARYSYTGAIRMLHLPSVLFFDIGGGSFEVVVAKNYEIKKSASFPLGALRLTKKFSKDDTFDKVDFDAMKKYIDKTLGTPKTLGISEGNSSGSKSSKTRPRQSLSVVGVGGAVRSLAKYIQDKKQYPFSKTHNYRITLDDLENMWKKISDLSPEKISKISAISSQRADTIRAAMVVIMTFLKKTGFDEIVVSAHGLREGALALSMQHSSAFLSQSIDERHIRATILGSTSTPAASASSHVEKLVDILLSANLMRPSDRPIIHYALEQTDRLNSFRDVSNILYTIMDDDTSLSHEDQLSAALAVVDMRKRHKADANLVNFEAVSGPYDKKWVRRISAIVSLYHILSRSSTILVPALDTSGSITLTVRPASESDGITNKVSQSIPVRFPILLFKDACKQLEDAFDIPFHGRMDKIT